VTSLENLASVRADGDKQVLVQLCADCVAFLHDVGVERDRIVELAAPTVVRAYNERLHNHADPQWTLIERDIRGATLQ